MKKEIEFIKSATKKLRNKGDITQEEADYIFILATVMYAYELGQHFGKQYLNNFNFKFNYPDVSEALKEWYDEVRSQITDGFEFHNFITTIPSIPLCPVLIGVERSYARTLHAIYEVWYEKGHILERNWTTSNNLHNVDERMFQWLKENAPLSFDIMPGSRGKIHFVRYGVLGLLPVYESEIEQEKLHKLTETKTRVPKDVAYIESLTYRLYSHGDISLEEADNLYLLLKMYQILRARARQAKEPEAAPFRQKIRSMAEPGLNALYSWYETVEKMLKQNKRGNFVYTLPSDLDMNLYQLRKPIERSLKMLPEEPSEIVARFKDEFIVKDVLLDTKFTKETGVSDEYVRYHSSRYGFFRRNGINLSKWKPVMRCEKSVGEDILDRSLGIPILGKLRFAEFSLGIKQIVMGDAVAVKEEDYQKMLEVLKLSDSKIMEIAELLVQKELEEIQTERGKLAKTSENSEKLDALERRESILKRESGIPLEHVIKGVEIAYKAQRDREEYLDEDEWLEIDR